MESEPLGIQQDDVVRILETDELAFVEHVGGETSEEEDGDETDESFEMFRMYHNEPANLQEYQYPGAPRRHFIDQYDDDADTDVSDDEQAESTLAEKDIDSEPSHTDGADSHWGGTIASTRTDGLEGDSASARGVGGPEDDSHEQSDDEKVPVGSVRVLVVDSAEERVVTVRDVRVMDRSFIPGDAVRCTFHRAASETDPATASGTPPPLERSFIAREVPNRADQSALVTKVSKTLVVRVATPRDTPPSQRGESSNEPAETFEIPSEDLEFFSGLRDGGFVVSNNWLGRVTYFSEAVTVKFSNGAMCKVPGHPEAVMPADMEEDQPIDDVEGLYYPGQIVKADPSVWRSALWITGSYPRERTGVVSRVEVHEVAVDWMATKYTEDFAPDEDEPPDEIVSPSEVTPLSAFRHLWWRVGDRGKYLGKVPTKAQGEQHSPSPGSQSTSHVNHSNDRNRNASGGEDAEDDGEGEWEEEEVDDPSLEMAPPRPVRNSSGRLSAGNSRRRRPSEAGGGRLLSAQRRMHGGRQDESSAEEHPFTVLEVVNTRTYVDLLWQDGTSSTRVPAFAVLSNRHLDAYDFFPGTFISQAPDDLDEPVSSPQSNDNPQARSPIMKTGVVVKVNSLDRTAVVRWEEENAVFGADQEVSVYELNESGSYDLRIADTVLRVPGTGATPESARHTWVGEVVGTGIGTMRVLWHDGGIEDVPPDCLLVVNDPDEDDDEDEEAEGHIDGYIGEVNEGVGAEDGLDSGHLPLAGSGERGNTEAHRITDDLADNWGEDEEDLTTPDPTGEGKEREIVSQALEAARGLQSLRPDQIHVRPSTLVTAAVEHVLSGWSLGNGQKRPDAESFIAEVGRKAVQLMNDQFVATEDRQADDPFVSDPVKFAERVATVLAACVSHAKGYTVTEESLQGQTAVGDVVLAKLRAFLTAADESSNVVSPTTSDEPSAASASAAEVSAGATDSVSDPLDGFERFATVDSIDTHQFAAGSSTDVQPSPGFVSVVRKEWTRLSRNLPRGIFVHWSESRLDLLRAAIVGPVETPYEDGLYFFDIALPPDYPSTPPKVHFMSHGRRLNPNLYEDGKVCLSILGTWDGDGVEEWNPRNSNVLRVLLSLQAMVFVEEPYFNEAGYEKQVGTAEGISNSKLYNESVFLLCLRHMVTSLRPAGSPEDFATLSVAHFSAVSPRILERCRTLLNRTDKPRPSDTGGPEDRPEGAESEPEPGTAAPSANSSEGFKRSLHALLPKLETAFLGLSASK